MLAVLQARMTSTRLPGKVLEPVQGRPMIIRQIERITRASRLDNLVVATSIAPSDDLLVDVLQQHGQHVVRGPLDDVLGRFAAVIDEFQPDAVVRLTGDCPLISPVVIDRIIGEFEAERPDYCSNTLQPSFPDGVDVEVVRADALSWLNRVSTDAHEREHVTLGVYRRPDRFRLLNVSHPTDLSNLRWTVDTADDLQFVRDVYAALYPVNPEFDIDDVVAYLERHPERSRTTEHAKRNAALDGLDTGAMRHE